jgi:hypothetical protein
LPWKFHCNYAPQGHACEEELGLPLRDVSDNAQLRLVEILASEEWLHDLADREKNCSEKEFSGGYFG